MSHDQTHQATHALPAPEKSNLGAPGVPARPMTRDEARELGLPLYFTGLACRNGHVAPRYTSVGLCVVCQRAHSAGYRKKNGEIVRAKGRVREAERRARLKAAGSAS